MDDPLPRPTAITNLFRRCNHLDDEQVREYELRDGVSVNDLLLGSEEHPTTGSDHISIDQLFQFLQGLFEEWGKEDIEEVYPRVRVWLDSDQ